MSKFNILILSGSPNSYSITRIKEEAEKQGHDVDVINPLNFFAYISPVKNGFDRLYLKSDNDEIRKVIRKKIDVVIPRFAGQSIFDYGCTIVAHINKNLGIPTTSEADGLRLASNKLATCQQLSFMKIRTIKTIFANQPTDFSYIINLLDGLPIICKTLTGSMGSGVFVLETELSASTTLSAFSKLNVNLILQKFIDSGTPKNDLRVYVIDGKISGAYKRYAIDSDFRSNYSLSHIGEKVTLTDEEIQMAKDSSLAIGLPVCACDIIRHTKDNDKPYMIEINGNGNLRGAEKVTGKNIAKDIVDYAVRLAIRKKHEPVPDDNANGSAGVIQTVPEKITWGNSEIESATKAGLL